MGLAKQIGIDKLIVPHKADQGDSDCHCGSSDRALFHETVGDHLPDIGKHSVHIVTQPDDSAVAHYHKILSETYVFIECGEGAGIELDGETYPVEPLTRVCIPPGVRHRVRGCAKFLVVVIPGHRESKDDDYFD